LDELPLLTPKPDALSELFSRPKPVIGVIHLPPLPGAPRYSGESMEEIVAAAQADARRLTSGGVDGIIIENAFDLPFARPEDIGPETVAALTAACLRARDVTDLPIGITLVANGAIPALAVAKAVGARWVRVNQWVNAYVANEGLIDGPAGRAMRYRSAIHARDVRIFADVDVKFGAHAITADRSLEEQTRDLEFFDADVVIVSGTRTGSPTELSKLRRVKAATRLPVLVGSGLSAQSAFELLSVADGAIVGSALKEDGCWWRPVDQRRVEELVAEANRARTLIGQK
jgi:membrane complex biogenesis BtpA family protein